MVPQHTKPTHKPAGFSPTTSCISPFSLLYFIMNYHPPFIENECYHVFNHANGREPLFITDDNYQYFLRQLKKYILPVANLYAYSLLPNHYHLLLQIKPAEKISDHFTELKRKEPTGDWLPAFVSKCFSNWQNSYSKAFNKMHGRMGSLFISPIRRVTIVDDMQLAATIFYVHKNAVHHGYCINMEEWKYSSFSGFLSNQQTALSREYVLNFFGGKEAFISFHTQPIELKNAAIIEQ